MKNDTIEKSTVEIEKPKSTTKSNKPKIVKPIEPKTPLVIEPPKPTKFKNSNVKTTLLTPVELAKQFKCDSKKIRVILRKHKIEKNDDGKYGWTQTRYDEIAKIIDSEMVKISPDEIKKRDNDADKTTANYI